MTSLRQWFLNHVWYVQPSPILIVQGTPHDCLRALAAAARPSKDRLHFRNLFMDGRRYYLDARDNGFQLTSDSAIPWRRKGRTFRRNLAKTSSSSMTTKVEGPGRVPLNSPSP